MTVRADSWNEHVRGEQVPALINLDGQYLRVEAGPGTGKTFGLVRRVERVLHPWGLAVPGAKVLVVAFNRVIAEQLRQEINARLDEIDFTDPRPVIRTIHSLCVETVGAQRLLMPHEEEAMLYDVLAAHEEIKKRYVREDKTAQALRDHEAGHKEDHELWAACRQWLVRHHATLINDLPGMLLTQLQAGDLPDKRYEHLFVDEFQDLTPGEQQLVVRLLSDEGCLIALGDPRQSIYHFRGNDPQGLAKLEELLGAPIIDIPLTECQRCPAPIVDAANRLMIDHSSAPMKAVSDVAANTHVVVWKNPAAEVKGMAPAIAKSVERFPDDRHLIMVTRRKFGYDLRSALASVAPGLDVSLSFSEGVLETWPAREAFLVFNLLVDPDAAGWRAWFAYQAPSPPGKSFKAASRNAAAYLDLLSTAGDAIDHEVVRNVASRDLAVRGTGVGNIRERASRYSELAERFAMAGIAPEEFINRVFSAAEWQLGGEADRVAAELDLDLLRQNAAVSLADLASIAPPGTDPTELLVRVARRLRGQIARRDPLVTDDGPRVKVATLWSAKGVTADHVYVLGVNREMIPGQRRPDYPGTDLDYFEEQKRLFYVTITRSKRTLVLSRCHKIQRGQAADLGIAVDNPNALWPELHVSPFLQQIMNLLPDGIQGEDWAGC